MILTNHDNLPEPYVEYIRSRLRKPAFGRVSATSLYDAPKIRHLLMKHWDVLEADVSEYLWMVMGNLLHGVLESAATEDFLVEEKILWHGISMRPDLYVPDQKKIVDYKLTTVWSHVYEEYESQDYQLNIYRLGYRDSGFEVEKLENVYFFRDWSRMKAKQDAGYPQKNILTRSAPIMDLSSLIPMWKADHESADNGAPRPCTPAEQWATEDTWAVIKKDGKRATKVCKSQAGAEEDIKARKGIYEIVFRPGELKRCNDYCPARKVCHQVGRGI